MDAAALVGQARRRGAVQLADAFPLVDAAAGAGDPGHGVTAFQQRIACAGAGRFMSTAVVVCDRYARGKRRIHSIIIGYRC